MPERVAFVGSRGFSDMQMVRRRVAALPFGSTVVSGGMKDVTTYAGGRDVDSVAIDAAREVGLETSVHLPDWSKGKQAGKHRNWDIAYGCDRMEAFWDGVSNGTAHAIAAACRYGRPVRVWMAGDS